MNGIEKYKSQLIIVTGLVILFFIFKSTWFLYSAALLGIIFLAIPAMGNLIIKGWFKLAEGLGWINSKVLLSVVFYFVLFPMSLINKLFSKDTMQLKKTTDSLYQTRNHTYKKGDLENLW